MVDRKFVMNLNTERLNICSIFSSMDLSSGWAMSVMAMMEKTLWRCRVLSMVIENTIANPYIAILTAIPVSMCSDFHLWVWFCLRYM